MLSRLILQRLRSESGSSLVRFWSKNTLHSSASVASNICFKHDNCNIGDSTRIVRPLVTEKIGNVLRVLTVAKAMPLGILTASIGIVALAGCSGSGSTTPTATPTFTPGTGTYKTSQTITIASPTSGSVLYCTTDGSTPTASSPQCSEPMTISKSETVKALAIAPGQTPSPVATAAYTINLPGAAAPVFSPAGGGYATAQTVTITDTIGGALIYYTTDGSTPTAASTQYDGPITVSSTETINAIALAGDYGLSAVAMASYTIATPAPGPTISGPGGITTTTYGVPISVALADTDSNATIYYAIGTPATTESTQYSGPIIVSASETINAIAIDLPGGYSQSTMSSQSFITLDAPPVFSQPSGGVSSGMQIAISDADPSATIYYSIGAASQFPSTLYTGPIPITGSETISAVAIDTANNYAQSAQSSASYTVASPTPTPTIAPTGGNTATYPASLSVAITDSDSNAQIYYTTDGSTPSQTHGNQYAGPLTVAETTTISAIAIDVAAGNSASSPASQQLTILEAVPAFSQPAGAVASGAQISITDIDPRATIYYTTNGGAATTASTLYTGPISITSAETINAVALDSNSSSNYAQSMDASAAYTLQSPAPTPTIASAGGASVTTFPGTFSVSISDSDVSANVYYTTDGSTPSAAHGVQYTAPFLVSSTETVTAIALDLSHGYTASVPSAQPFSVVEATPSFSPAAGTVSSGTQVSINDADPGAAIYYTTNGSQASPSSSRYSGPITVTASETVNAIAVNTSSGSSYTQSLDASAAYNLSGSAPVPVISSVGGASTTYPGTLSVTIADTNTNAAIYYTTDGSGPSQFHGTLYNGAITVASTETITAVAVDLNHGYTNSSSVSQSYTVAEATPTIAPAAGNVASGTQVTISDADSGAAIYYTTNGSPASTSSTPYAGPITLTATETINAIAVDTISNYTVSQDASAAYTIAVVTTPPPSISSASGTSTTYPSTFSVTVADTDTNATIYYTTDGSTPSASNGTQYTGTAFSVSSTETVSAIAIDSSNASTVATQLFTVQEAEPQFAPPAGNIPASGASITITDVDPNATIYYTIDGNPATTSSTQYTGPVSVSSATTINAVSIDTKSGSNYTLSMDVSAAYALCPAHSVCGSVMSGNLPIDGATVQLYAAGKTGYGSGAKALSTTPSTITTNSAGAFSLKLPTCPSAPGDQLYLAASGGSTSGGSSETNIALMVTLGSCSKLASVTSVTINEVTTIASAYALSGFATPNGSGPGIVVGAPAPSASCSLAQTGNSTCNYNGLVNAFRTVNNLVNTTSGTPLTITEFYSGSDPNNPNGWSSSYGDTQAPYTNCSSSPSASNCLSYNNPVPSDPISGMPFQASTYQATNTSLVPFQRLNTLGNVLASCVEQLGNCAGLSTLTNGAADTLQAALYIAQNPGKWSGTAGLYGQVAQPATSFTPPYGDGTNKTTLTAEPNDWTLAISFTGGGLGINPVVDGTDALVNQTLAIDIAGNVWVTAVPAAPTGQPLLTSGSTGMMAGFDPIGESLTPATSLVGGSVAVDATNTLPYSSFGGLGPDSPYSGSVGIFGQPAWLAIDTTNPEHVWVSNNSATDPVDPGPVQLKESHTIAPGNASNLQPQVVGPSCNNPSYNALTDGDMAIDGNYIWQMNYDGTLTFNDSNGQCVSAISLGLGYSSGNIGLALDSLGNIWIGDGGGTQVVETSTSNTSGAPSATYNNVYNSPIAIDTFAAGTNGNMYACNANQNGYLVLNASNSSGPVSTFTTSNSHCGAFLTVDGAGNIWSYGGSVPANANPQQALDEVTPTGTQISPNGGFTATSTGEQTATGLTTINSDTNSSVAGGGIAIDPSGNLWFLNGQAGAQASTYLPTNALVEFIGVAAPTVTPTALATQNGVQATKP